MTIGIDAVFRNWYEAGLEADFVILTYPEEHTADVVLRSFLGSELNDLRENETCLEATAISPGQVIERLEMLVNGHTCLTRWSEPEETRALARRTFGLVSGGEWREVPEDLGTRAGQAQWNVLDSTRSRAFPPSGIQTWLVCIDPKRRWLVEIAASDESD